MGDRKYSGKWYLDNEKKVLKSIGLVPCKGSGNGELEKEDGFNDNVIAQLKSTSKNSFTLTSDDLEKLKYHATVDHKLPLFLIEFIEKNELWFCCRKEDIVDVVVSMFKEEILLALEKDYEREIFSSSSLSPGGPEEEIEWKPPKKIKTGDNKGYRERKNKQWEERNKK